jgi:hypothetical protein
VLATVRLLQDSHLGEEIFHFDSQVRDGVIDRFEGVAHDFRGGLGLRRCAGDNPGPTPRERYPRPRS